MKNKLRFKYLVSISVIGGLFLAACQGQDRSGTAIASKGNTQIFGGGAVAQNTDLARAIVLVRYKDENGNPEQCTGTLLNSQIVLTAAHCLGTEMRVAFTTDAEATDSLSQNRWRDVVDSVKPTGYNSSELYNGAKTAYFDVALLKLRSPAPAGSLFIRLADRFFGVSELSTAMIAGYGRLDVVLVPGKLDANGRRIFNIVGDAILRSAIVNRVESGTESLIEFEQKQTGACVGDSGGPVLMSDDNDQFRIIGVASKFPNATSCHSNFLATSTSVWKNWIQTNMQKLLQK